MKTERFSRILRALAPLGLLGLWACGSPNLSSLPVKPSPTATPVPTAGKVTLHWTAPGDDADTGRAAAYDLRYSTAPIIDDASFGSATRVSGVPAPQAAGATESFTVTGLVAGSSYYFAIKTVDEAGNWSALSNDAAASASAAVVFVAQPQ